MEKQTTPQVNPVRDNPVKRDADAPARGRIDPARGGAGRTSNGVNRFICGVATFFGLGYFPLFPGTVAALAGVGLYLLVYRWPFAYALLTVCVLIIGFLSSGRAAEAFGEKDPEKIVIDEVAGMLIALFMLPSGLPSLVIGFLIFRTIDGWKPHLLRVVEEKEGSLGIMGDDILAGIFTNILLQCAIRIWSVWIR